MQTYMASLNLTTYNPALAAQLGERLTHVMTGLRAEFPDISGSVHVNHFDDDYDDCGDCDDGDT